MHDPKVVQNSHGTKKKIIMRANETKMKKRRWASNALHSREIFTSCISRMTLHRIERKRLRDDKFKGQSRYFNQFILTVFIKIL